MISIHLCGISFLKLEMLFLYVKMGKDIFFLVVNSVCVIDFIWDEQLPSDEQFFWTAAYLHTDCIYSCWLHFASTLEIYSMNCN